MNQLKHILQSKSCYVILIIFTLIYVLVETVLISYESKYSGNETEITGKVIEVKNAKDKLSLTVLGKEKIIVNYYEEEPVDTKNLLGNVIVAKGKIKKPNNNTIPNTFNYKRYLYNKKVYYTFTAKEIEIKSSNKGLYKLKNILYNHAIRDDDTITNYLNLFILGNKSYFDNEMYSYYTHNGVSHLFAISGMHISFLFLLLNKLLKKVRRKHIVIMLFFWLYAFVVSFSASVLRAVLFMSVNYLCDYFDLKIDNKKKLYLTASIILIVNPFMILDIGFIYSFVITFFIFHFTSFIKGNYLEVSIRLSLITTLASLPITALLNYEINLLGIFNNLIFIPLVVFIVYPLSLLTYLLPFCAFLFKLSLNILEFLNIFFEGIKIFTLNVPKMSSIIVIMYYLLLFNSIKKKRLLFILPILILINSLTYILDNNYYVIFFDIGQGDSSIIISPRRKEVVMIDTGGLMGSDYKVSDNTIKYLKSIGITKIDLLIISHGDADHGKEALNVIDKLDVKNVLLNKNKLNSLEKSIKRTGKVVNDYRFKTLKMNNYNDYICNDENNSSIITNLKIFNYDFLFMGDAGVEEETDLISKYNFKDIDILKVGHHGSKTSSSKDFIDKVNPRYSIISVGKNNRFGHPNDWVLDILKNSKIYRTDKDGSIIFKIKNNKLEIETYSP